MSVTSKHKLYNTTIPSSLPKTEGEFGKSYMYRDKGLDLLACRYYYFTAICRMRYDDCLLQLTKEFSRSISSLERNLKKRHSFISTMVVDEVSTRKLRQDYPWLVWDGKPIHPTPLPPK